MVDDRINHIPKEMPGRLVPDVQVPEDWFDDIGVVDERDDTRRVAAQSVQLARHAAAIPAHSWVVSEQFEHFQQPATAGVVPETAFLLHQLKQQLHGCLVVLFDHLAERQLVKGLGVVRIGRESGLEFGRGGGPPVTWPSKNSWLRSVVTSGFSCSSAGRLFRLASAVASARAFTTSRRRSQMSSNSLCRAEKPAAAGKQRRRKVAYVVD